MINTVYGNFIDNRKQVLLKNLCVKDGIQTGPFGSLLHQKDYVATGTPIITVEHLGENRILGNNVPCVTDEDKERLSRYTLKTGDIVFSRVGSVDRRSLVREIENGWLFSGRCLRIRPNQEIIDSRYLSWFFGLEVFKDYVRKIAVGATMPSLNTDLLSDIPVILPPIAEQRAIADVLSALDDKIELNRRMNQTLEELAQTLFKHWFIENENLSKMTIPLSSLIREILSGDWGNEDKEVSDDEEVFCIRGTDIDGIRQGSLAKTPIRWVDNKSIDKRRALAGDIVIELSGGSPTQSTGRSCRIHGHLLEHISRRIVCSNFCKLVRVKNNDNSLFLSYLLKDLYSKGEFFQYENGTTGIKNFAFGHFIKKYEIPENFSEFVNSFNKQTEPLIEKIVKNTFESQTLAELRDTLLPRLMSGQVRVKL